MVRIASVNVNGVRAAFRKGMGEWLEAGGFDIVALQEVRAQDEDLLPLVPGWHVLHDPATAKGRAGVAVLSREPSIEHRTDIGLPTFDTKGRWLEADFLIGETLLTVVSTYVHSGEAGTPKQVAKMKFLDSMAKRLPKLREHSEHVVIMGDLNVGHTQLDIKNWRTNQKVAGFLPEERAYFDRFFGTGMVTGADGKRGRGHGWVDVGRAAHPDVAGPYTWWSQRGKAFDNDAGWRIDYQMASPALAARASDYRVDRAPSYDTRWSDHSPVIVDYDL
ncbi:exodeoxyribonuclease III [Agrococcus beijingensis]|uniref:exodeoxyribonuclease III n=1 Tax=Agrococcus beijingensis TaxID=3068634 RepID=UPI002741AD51|nr:exodeoxyribonuclease III [Agrococcus sp. REN33]